MKNILLSILGVLSIVVSLAFSSYSVNAASNEWSWPLGKPYGEIMKKDDDSGTLHLTEEVLISMMGLTLVLLFMEMAVCMLCMMVKFYMLVGIL